MVGATFVQALKIHSDPKLSNHVSPEFSIAFIAFVSALVWSYVPDNLVNAPQLNPSIDQPAGSSQHGR